MDLNKVMLIGRLGQSPEMTKIENSGTIITKFYLATNFSPNKDEKKTEWHNIVAFGKLGEICNAFLAKGKLVYVEGRISTTSWKGDDDIKRYKTSIVINNMIMLGSKSENKEDEIPF